MKDNLFDKYVKDQMDGLRPDVGSHLWENIAKKMEQKKTAIFWSLKKLMLLLLLVFVTVGSGFYIFNKIANKKNVQFKNNDLSKNNIVSQNEKLNAVKQNDLLTNENDYKNTTIKSSNFVNTNAAVKIKKNSISTTVENNLQTTSNNNIGNDNKNLKRYKKIVSINDAAANKNSSTKKPLLTQSNNSSSTAQNVNTTTYSKYTNENKIASNNAIIQKKIILSNNDNLLEENKPSFLKMNNKKYYNKKSTKNINVANAIITARTNEQQNVLNYLQPFTSELDFMKPKNIFDIKITSRVFPIIPCPEIEKNAAGNKKYLEFYAGPDFIIRSFSDTGKVYAAQRKASTGIYFAYSAGLRYIKVYKSGMSIRTGVNYSQINERFVSFDGYILERIVQVNAAGDTTANFTQFNTQYKKSTNIYKSLDIPFQLGYEMGNGRLHTNIGLGININIASRQTGSVLDNTGKPVNISTNAASSIYQFKTNAGVSFLGSVSFYYKLSDRWHLMLEPYVRYSLSPYTKPDISFKQKFNAAGLRLGIRRDF